MYMITSSCTLCVHRKPRWICPVCQQNVPFSELEIDGYVITYIPTTVEPVYYGHLGTNKKCPDYQVLIFQVIKHHLGPSLSVWIMQVSLFSSVLINRFHCTTCIAHVSSIFQDGNMHPCVIKIQ